MGILAALLRRNRTGQGCRVDVSLLSAAIDLQLESFVCYLNGTPPESVRQPRHIAGWYYPAPYGIYRTRDGELAISLAGMDVLAEVLEVPEIATVTPDEAFARNEAIADLIATGVARKTTAEWQKIMTERAIWHAPVNDYEAVVGDPQVRHNGNFVTLDGAAGEPITLVGHPVRYDGAMPEVRLPPQPLGAQSREILQELGYAAVDVDKLIGDGVVGAPAES
jgi:crotonobetainyl-CoA:carnitine CoA-transferase CaiB-like acyl-CoA transferase